MSGSLESTRLALLRAELGKARSASTRAPQVAIGVQEADDAALVELPGSTESLVIASDFIRGSGFLLFKLGLLSYEDIGYYLVAANLSDMAAMGAHPVGLTTVVRYSSSMTDTEFCDVFRGIRLAADDYDTPIVGGDIGGYECDVFAATAFGRVRRSEALLRSGARPDHLVCLAGSIGLPITALAYFVKAKPAGLAIGADEERRLLLSWRRPIARVKEGLLLRLSNFASACQDVSDGLRATVEQLAASSGVAIVLDESSVHLDPTTKRVAEFLGVSALTLAMSASVDFSLLFTMEADREEACRHEFEAAGVSFTTIGRVVPEGRNGVMDVFGKLRDLSGVAWQHQSGDWLGALLAGRP